jgi:hypothetical protein
MANDRIFNEFIRNELMKTEWYHDFMLYISYIGAVGGAAFLRGFGQLLYVKPRSVPIRLACSTMQKWKVEVERFLETAFPVYKIAADSYGDPNRIGENVPDCLYSFLALSVRNETHEGYFYLPDSADKTWQTIAHALMVEEFRS